MLRDYLSSGLHHSHAVSAAHDQPTAMVTVLAPVLVAHQMQVPYCLSVYKQTVQMQRNCCE